MAGSISTLGIGSGLQLQDIIDQLREVDQKVVDQKKTDITKAEQQLESFTVVNNKLLTMKSSALSLSLSSNFLSRSVTSSNENVLTATVMDGSAVQSTSVEVTRLASRSSWMGTSGVASGDAIAYVPVSQQSTTGVADPTDNGVIDPANRVGQNGDVLKITFGASETITVTATADWSMNDLMNALNDPANDPNDSIDATTYQVDGNTYLRIATKTAGGSGEANRVAITQNDTALTFEPPNKTMAFNVGSTTMNLSVAADTTMNGLVDLINNSSTNPGVTATLVNDGNSADTPYRLVLQADSAGEDNRISMLAMLPDLAMTEQQGASSASLNASFKMDGITYQRQSNTVSDIITGVTFTLQGTSTSAATVSVTNNNDTIRETITSLVSSYNDVLQEIQSGVAYDEETEAFGVLANTTIRDMPYQLQNLMTSFSSADAEGNIRSMFDLGLEFNRDGTVTINSSVLDAALADHPEGVQAFFLGDEEQDIQGVGDKLNNFLRTVTSGTGQLEGEKSTAQARIDSLTLKITTDTEALNKKYELLAKRFTELDRYMRQMTSISNYLTSQFSSSNSSGSSSEKK